MDARLVVCRPYRTKKTVAKTDRDLDCPQSAARSLIAAGGCPPISLQDSKRVSLHDQKHRALFDQPEPIHG